MDFVRLWVRSPAKDGGTRLELDFFVFKQFRIFVDNVFVINAIPPPLPPHCGSAMRERNYFTFFYFKFPFNIYIFLFLPFYYILILL